MIKQILLLLLSGVTFWSCTGDDPECDACDADAAGKVDVTFQFQSNGTKAVGTPPNGAACDNISNFQVFIFNVNNKLETSQYFEAKGNTAVTLKVVPGVKDFYAVANYGKTIEDINSKEDLASLVADIRDNMNQKPDFLMAGQLFNKTISNLPDNDSDNDVYMEVERLVSRIQLRYKLDFSNSNYKDKDFVVDSVYLLNGNTKATYTFTTSGGKTNTYEPADGLNNFRNPFLGLFCQTGRWEKNGSDFYPGPDAYNWFYFYTFANQSEDLSKATMIVISAILDGTRTYYPIIVNKTGISYEQGGVPAHSLVTNNALYLITATIKGRGGDEPEIPVEYVDMGVSVEVKGWSNVSEETEFN